MDKKPFALIVDCFKAHVDQKVKNLVQKLHIDLIVVPACGTGKYQLLDRKIFGIVKAKLRSIEACTGMVRTAEQQQLRHSHVLHEMEKAWNEVSDRALISAWGIPGLEKLMKQ